MVLKLFAGTKYHENGQKSQRWWYLVHAKFNAFKVLKIEFMNMRWILPLKCFKLLEHVLWKMSLDEQSG